ncbi:hypothetical protein KKG41_04360 [Patescibacteria group bacterium]|nr:hypothetical protein [Patescibacteria group bacterium]MBU1890005.1 hypothetical protein [Patescibacteria group bacterium]
MKKHKFNLIFIFGSILVAGGLFLIIDFESSNESDISVKTNIIEHEVINTLIALDDGKLTVLENGRQRIVNDYTYTHLFGLTSTNTVWLGVKTYNPIDASNMYPSSTYILSEIDIEGGNEIQTITITDVDLIVYERNSKRFVIQYIQELDGKDSNSSPVSISVLNEKGEVIDNFEEFGATGIVESDGGIILVTLQSQPMTNRYLFLMSDGEKVYREYENMDFSEIFFVQGLVLKVTESDSGYAVTDYNTQERFIDSPLRSVYGFFSIGDEVFLRGVQSDYTAYPQLYRVREDGNLTHILGDHSFISEGVGKTFVYAEPIDSQYHVRLWETDLDGKNARLILDDYDLPWHSYPIVVK